jgi:hypothetical protein
MVSIVLTECRLPPIATACGRCEVGRAPAIVRRVNVCTIALEVVLPSATMTFEVPTLAGYHNTGE